MSLPTIARCSSTSTWDCRAFEQREKYENSRNSFTYRKSIYDTNVVLLIYALVSSNWPASNNSNDVSAFHVFLFIYFSTFLLYLELITHTRFLCKFSLSLSCSFAKISTLSYKWQKRQIFPIHRQSDIIE